MPGWILQPPIAVSHLGTASLKSTNESNLMAKSEIYPGLLERVGALQNHSLGKWCDQ
jgi:hypothetical protein